MVEYIGKKIRTENKITVRGLAKMAGIAPKTVQAYLGHASLQMTMDLYTSVMPKQMETEMDKVSKELDRISEYGDELAEKQFENMASNNKIVSFRGDSMVV